MGIGYMDSCTHQPQVSVASVEVVGGEVVGRRRGSGEEG